MKLCRSVSFIFVSVLSSLILLFLVFSLPHKADVVYGDNINGPAADSFILSPGTPANAYAYPGEIVTYTHSLTNTGFESDVFTITVTSSFTLTLPKNPFTQTLDADQGSYITVSVSIPTDAAESFQDELEVSVQSTNDPSQKATEVNTTTVRYHKLFLPIVLKSATWESIGSNWPSDAAALSVAVCETDPDLIIAGTLNHGVLVFNGTSWQTTNVPTDSSVTGLVMNQACDRAYAGLYDGGVWQGQRSGNIWSWSQIGGSAALSTRSLALAGARLFASGDFGIRYWDGNSWQTTNGIIGTQPVMYISAADPADSNSKMYAVQWQVNKVYQASANAPTWMQLAQTVPNSEMRAVFGNVSEPRFVGTQSGSYQFNGSAWQALSVPAGLRAGVVTDTAAYLGYTGSAGVYKVQGSTPTPLNAGWSTPPEFIYDLVLAGDKLYAATTTGVWVYSQP